METSAQSPSAAAMSVMDDFWRIATLPMGLCCSAWLHLLWPCHVAAGYTSPPPSDHQLVVPEPIEEEGEHALFA